MQGTQPNFTITKAKKTKGVVTYNSGNLGRS